MKSVVRYNKGSNEKKWKKDGTDEYLIEWKKKKNCPNTPAPVAAFLNLLQPTWQQNSQYNVNEIFIYLIAYT